MPVSDLSAIEAFLRRAPYLHAYELGDLDPAELPHCSWFAGDPVDAVALIYRGLATPTLVALDHESPGAMNRLLATIALPPRFYAHVTAGVEAALLERCDGELLGHHLKMGLAGAPIGDPGEVTRLGPRDVDDVIQFYAAAYPASYFEPANLVRGPYVAVRDEHGLAAIAGVHVYSPAMRVASLGNIATRPDARGRGHARRVTTAMCRLLRPEIDVIGLNVRADNAAAIACYRAVGFETHHHYDEWRFTARAGS